MVIEDLVPTEHTEHTEEVVSLNPPRGFHADGVVEGSSFGGHRKRWANTRLLPATSGKVGPFFVSVGVFSGQRS